MTEERVWIYEDNIEDGVQAVLLNKEVRITCFSTWCGDSETGYGASVGYDLPIEQVKSLYKFLGAWLREKGK